MRRRALSYALLAPNPHNRHGGAVQMLGLLGYADRTSRTPRWPLEAKLTV